MKLVPRPINLVPGPARPGLRVAATLAAALALGALLPAAPAAATAAGSQALSRAPGSGLVVRWHARTQEPGGSFRLYAGPDPGQLELLLETPSVVGEGRYVERTAEPAAALLLLELRYAEKTGRERVLESVWVRTVSLQPTELVAPSRDLTARLVSSAFFAPPVRSSELVVGVSFASPAFTPEPEGPPPRGAAPSFA